MGELVSTTVVLGIVELWVCRDFPIMYVLGTEVHKAVPALQGMGARQRRDNLRRTWVPTGKDLKRLEEERGVVIRFVIGYRFVSAPLQACWHQHVAAQRLS